jgi:hypothetical protein
MERPNDGKVADNGTFVLSDWRFGDQLRSTFYAFDSQGRQLLSHEFGANALKSGLSPDGRFAVYMTAGGDHPDASKMTLLDLTSRELLWSLWPPSGAPTSYAFDTAATAMTRRSTARPAVPISVGVLGGRRRLALSDCGDRRGNLPTFPFPGDYPGMKPCFGRFCPPAPRHRAGRIAMRCRPFVCRSGCFRGASTARSLIPSMETLILPREPRGCVLRCAVYPVSR